MARVTRMTKRRLGELLQAEGLVTEEQVRLGLEEQRKSNLFLGEALVKLGFVSEDSIAQTIVQQFSLPFLSAQQYNISIDVLNLFPERMYYEYQFITLDKMSSVLLIVGAGLMNHDVLDELERLSGCKVCQYVSTWKDIRSALDKHAKDLKKEQSNLSDLGSMLLDATPQPQPLPKVPPPPAVAVSNAAQHAPAANRVAASAHPQTAPQPNRAVAPAPPVPGHTNVVRPPGVFSPTAGTARISNSTMPAVGKPRISALSGARPPGASQSGPLSAVPSPPPPPPPPASGQQPAPPPADNPQVSPQKPGLLGLFKKPS